MMKIDQYTDQEIVSAILNRDTLITKEYLYRKCYPMFYAVYNKYYTDCDTPIELINEIYVYILYPNKGTGLCKLAGFGFRCTLIMWLKVVTEHYCHQLFARKIDSNDKIEVYSDKKKWDDYSLESDFRTLNMEDVHVILKMMPNKRYRRLIELRYLEEKSNEETAEILCMTMANYYNKHKLAKAQFCSILKKEALV